MKTIFTFLISTLLYSNLTLASQLFQVTSEHPEDVKKMLPFIKTEKKAGRLWLVSLKHSAPQSVMNNLRKISKNQTKHYEILTNDSISKSPTIPEYTSRIDSKLIKNSIEALASYKTRLVGTTDNQKATKKIHETFTSLGYTVTEYCYREGACSIVADKIGDRSTEDVIMLMGHFDSVGKDFAGADDNGSGIAVLMEIARIIKDYPNKKTMRFFATNGEESGLYGATHYANLLKKSGEISKIILAINMDMVGFNANNFVELETDSQYEGLAKWFAGLATTYTTLKSKITIGAWGSDHVPFIKGGVPTLLTIEDWSTKTPCYHTVCDLPNTINYIYAREIAKLNLAAMITKDLE